MACTLHNWQWALVLAEACNSACLVPYDVSNLLNSKCHHNFLNLLHVRA